jgi:hypothetical protein
VLDAVARVLRLGPAERWHLYRLADVPGIPTSVDTQPLPCEVPPVLDALDPKPACVYNGKYDLLACNESYAALFPRLAVADGEQRNALWQLFTMKPWPQCNKEMLPHMVATLRANYGRHVGEPEWTQFAARLCAASDEFAQLWASHEVAEPMPHVKSFQNPEVGQVDVNTSSFGVSGMPESRMIVYLPASPADAAKIERLRARLSLQRASQVSAAS